MDLRQLGLRKDDIILNHLDTAHFWRNVNATGRAYSTGAFGKVRKEEITLGDLAGESSSGSGGGETKENHAY